MNSLVGESVLDEPHRPFVTHVVEKATYVRIHDPVHSLPLDSHDQRIQRVVRAPPRPESVTETPEILLIDCVEDRHHWAGGGHRPRRIWGLGYAGVDRGPRDAARTARAWLVVPSA